MSIKLKEWSMVVNKNNNNNTNNNNNNNTKKNLFVVNIAYMVK